MFDDAAILLIRTRQKSGDVFKSYERDIEAVAEADKPRALEGSVDIQCPGENCGLIGDNAYRASVQPGESYNDVLAVMLVHLEKIGVVNDVVDYIFHVIGEIGLIGNNLIQRQISPIDGVSTGLARRVLEIIGGKKAE